MGKQTSYSDQQAKGFSGQVDARVAAEYLLLKNREASTSIPFGYAVCHDLAAPVTDQDALLPALETDLVCGIVAYNTSYSRSWTDSDGVVNGSLDGTGLLPNVLMSVASKARMLVMVEDAVLTGDRLWVRCTTGGAGEVIGGLLSADEGTETIDCTKQGKFLTSAAAGGLAWLDFDFTNKP